MDTQVGNPSSNEDDETKKKFLDFRLCIEIPQKIDKKDVEQALCKEISKTLKTLIKDKD